MTGFRRLALLLPVAAISWAAASSAQERPPAELFPQAMVVEHQLIEREADGTVFHGEPVRDTYGGSWIVSERSDGSRLVIDLARREMTEIRPAEGVYWTIGFARFGELRSRVADLDGGRSLGLAERSAAAAAGPAELEVVEISAELSDGFPAVAGKSAAGGKSAEREPLPETLRAPEVRRFEVREKGSSRPGAEVWVDGRIRLSEAAGKAIQAFEEDALGAPQKDQGPLDPARVMAAIRSAAAGALPVLTVLPVSRASGETVGESEDRVLAARRLETFPAELARVPEGLRRASHPLEAIVLALEEQARIDAALAGVELP